MKTKPYPPHEELPMVTAEPAVAYRRTDPAAYREMTAYNDDSDNVALEAFMNAAPDLSGLGDGFRPFTWEEARQWIAEAEAEIEAGEGQTDEEFFAELRRDFPWLY